MGGLDGADGLLQHGLLLLEFLPVVVPDDVGHPGGGHVPGHLVQVEESLVPLGPGGDGPSGQAGVDLHGDEQGVLHGVLGGAGVDGHAGDGDFGGGGVEVLVLDAPLHVPVQGVGVLRAEGGHIEVVGPLPNLLVRGKGDAELPVGQVLLPQLLNQGHNLGDARLVVRPQEGIAGGGDEGAALHLRQHREIGGADHPALLGQDHVPAVVVRVEDGLHPRPGEGGGGIHVGQQPQGRRTLAPRRGGKDPRHHPEPADPDLLQPQLPHLPLQQPDQVPLPLGTGAGPGPLGGLCVNFDVVEHSLIGAHKRRPPSIKVSTRSPAGRRRPGRRGA